MALSKGSSFVLKRTISMRSATTIDGFTVTANKHHTYLIEEGTLIDAVRNGYITDQEALQSRTMKARCIAREIMQNKKRKLEEISEEPPATSATINAKTTEKDDLPKTEDANKATDVAKVIEGEQHSDDE